MWLQRPGTVTTLGNSTGKQASRLGVYHQHVYGLTASGYSLNGHAFWIATEGVDIVMHPAQCGDQV